ncbi:hypothetical protein [Sinomicrobium soli]|uniref:hypothetical protein n=1 Tax=Sinomicrobium sp. N-1-3-6 TaxID=2219864 RepID=UPI000DCE8B7A|nr:hypothetical protein [Sinomicrobium sp. N-1-3-6]RAV30129.1 hypothetical protein DN748_04855 [Sinomicrobium sp. N-1-3-6]
MKKIFFTAVVVLFGAGVQAQENSTDNVTLNVKLHPIQSLVVNPSQKEVNLEYYSKEDYQNGVAETKQDHLTVYSTGGFQVKVKSSGSHLTGGEANLNANTVRIEAAAGSNPAGEAQYSARQLSADNQAIISSNSGGVDKNFNITYRGGDSNAYLDYYVAGQNPTVYTTSVTYTIVAQ